MADQTLFRARLTGVIIDDPADTGGPVDEKRALVEYIREDTAVHGSFVEEKGQANVLLPNGVYCPRYAAKLHFFATLDTITTPLALADQPRVIVRRDVSDVGTPTVCQAIVISPAFVAFALYKFGDSSTAEIMQGEFAEIEFDDDDGFFSAGHPGFFMASGRAPSVMTMPCPVLVTARNTFSTPAPNGDTVGWIIQPMATGDLILHTHLKADNGKNGGGPAFATFAPISIFEANLLGYDL